MFVSPSKKNESPFNTPFFKRETTFDVQMNTTASYSYKYTLIGIARVNASGLDIYDTYFLSRFSKKYDKDRKNRKAEQGKMRVERQHISRFLYHFIEILAIKSLVEAHKSTTDKINSFMNDLFGSLGTNSEPNKHQGKNGETDPKYDELNNLKSYIKPFVNNLFQKQLKVKKGSPLQQICHVDSQLKRKMQQIRNEVDNIDGISSSEYLPQKFTQQALKKVIIDAFQKVVNIEVCRMSLKKEILSLFVDINRNFMSVKVPHIMQTLAKTDNDKKGINEVILPKYTHDKQLIAQRITKMRLKEYLLPKRQRLTIQFQLIKDIILFLSRYHKSTNHFYPNLTASDICFDLKALKVFISHQPLILDAIGLSKKVKSLELQLLSESTPSTEMDKCHLQMDEKNISILKQKYSYPGLYRRRKDEMEDEKEGLSPQRQDIAKLEQSCHVWKLINIVYYISTGKNITNNLYNKYYLKQFQNAKEPVPFKMNAYKKIVKYIYDDFTKDPQYLISLLFPIKYQDCLDRLAKLRQTISQNAYQNLVEKQLKEFPDQQEDYKTMVSKVVSKFLAERKQRKEINESEQLLFDFSLKGTQQLFNILEDDDSLLQNLKMDSTKSEFYQRNIIVKQINNLLIDKRTFKKLMNAKKYLLLYLLAILQDIYVVKYVREQMKCKPNLKKVLGGEFAKDFKKIVFTSQFDKRKAHKRACEDKLKQYQIRKDVNWEFLMKNNSIWEDTIHATKSMQQIAQYERLQQQYLTRQRLDVAEAQIMLENRYQQFTKDQLEHLKQIRSSLKKSQYIGEVLDKLSKQQKSVQAVEGLLQEILVKNQLLFGISQKKYLFHILLKDVDSVKLAQLVPIAIERAISPQRINQLQNTANEEVVDIIVDQLFNKRLRSQTYERFNHLAKNAIRLNRERKKELASSLTRMKQEQDKCIRFRTFKQKWMQKIQTKVDHLYRTIHRDIAQLVKKEIQAYIGNSQYFHKIADFRQAKQPEQVCLYYNQKLLTFLKLYLSINDDNWRNYERLITTITFEDKAANMRSHAYQLEKMSKGDLLLLTEKLKIIRNSQFNSYSMSNQAHASEQMEKQSVPVGSYGKTPSMRMVQDHCDKVAELITFDK